MKHITYILILTIFLGCKSDNKKSDFGKTTNTEKKSESPINGKWKVINSTILPFEHISYCDKLELNSVFEFKTDGKLNVFESLDGKKCTKDQTYKVRGNKLGILEWDMAFDYEIMKLSTDTLELKIDRTPSYFWSESNLNDEKIKKELEKIKQNGIIISLEKIKNGG
jgi:hypothetical protein